MTKKISTALTTANIAAVLDILAATPTQFQTFSASLTSDQFRTSIGEGQRSLTEDLAHLLNSEARVSEMIYTTLMVDEPYFLDLHPDRDLGKLLHLERFDFADLLTYFKFRRTIFLNVLHSLTEAQWARVLREEDKLRKESVYWRARALALHEEAHIADLQKRLSSSK